MAKYVESCGATDAQNTSVVATGGLDKAVAIGSITSLFFASTDQKFDSILASKDVANWNTDVAAKKLIYLGDGRVEDTSTEVAFAEDAQLRLKAVSTPAIKSFNYIIGVCGCNVAELIKLKGRTGRLHMQTDKKILLATYTDAKDVEGFACTIDDVVTSLPTADAPWELTTISITLNDYAAEIARPARPVLEFNFKDVDQVYSAEGVASAISNAGSALNATLTITKDCTTDPLTGLLLADMKAVDVDGNVLTIATFTESGTTGVYSISITTALTLAYVTTADIVDVSDVLYYMESVTVSTT